MAEKERRGFFGRLFGDDKAERGEPRDVDEALPERASDPTLPRPEDHDERTGVESVQEVAADVRGGPDPDVHGPAAANTLTDEEAGASADELASGRITPLAEMTASAAQKKTSR
jgi:hypothetical protein